MGPLIFIARKHQIQRKKSQLNMRLMHISNQRQKIAEQIGQAQQAKTARQNLFNSTSRMAQNSIMSMMNIMGAANNYSNSMALNNGIFGVRQNYYNQLGTTLNGGIKVENIQEEVLKDLLNTNNLDNCTDKQYRTATKTVDGTTKEYYVLKNGTTSDTVKTDDSTPPTDAAFSYVIKENYKQQYIEAVNNNYQNQVSNLMSQSRQNELSQLTTNLAMNSMMGASNLFNNIVNSISNLGDEAELESLNAIDSQLEQEQTTVETQIKMLEAELQSVDKQLDNEIKQSAPKFSLGG